jgi:sulfate permease, SulP family
LALLDALKFARVSGLSMPALGRDVLSGFIGAMVQIAYCISFSALIFSISAGFPLGLAALLMGTVITGIVVAVTTTLSPATGGRKNGSAIA